MMTARRIHHSGQRECIGARSNPIIYKDHSRSTSGESILLGALLELLFGLTSPLRLEAL